MKVSFENLFALMQERGMERKDLIAITGLSAATVCKMAHNKVVTSQVIIRVYEALNIDAYLLFMPDLKELSGLD